MKFIDISVPHFGDDEPLEAAPQITTSSNHTHTFRPRQVEEYNLDDTRSIMSANTADDPEQSPVEEKAMDQFYEARDDTTEVSV